MLKDRHRSSSSLYSDGEHRNVLHRNVRGYHPGRANILRTPNVECIVLGLSGKA